MPELQLGFNYIGKAQGLTRNTSMDISGTPGKKDNACDLDDDQKTNFV